MAFYGCLSTIARYLVWYVFSATISGSGSAAETTKIDTEEIDNERKNGIGGGDYGKTDEGVGDSFLGLLYFAFVASGGNPLYSSHNKKKEENYRRDNKSGGNKTADQITNTRITKKIVFDCRSFYIYKNIFGGVG